MKVAKYNIRLTQYIFSDNMMKSGLKVGGCDQMTSDSITIQEQKKLLRKETLQRIATLEDAYMQSADRYIIQNLLSLEAYRAARTVFCFVGSTHEIQTVPFLEQVLADGKTLAVPLCIEKKGAAQTGTSFRHVQSMQAKQIRSLDELAKGHYGLLEPPAQAPTVLPSQIDLAVIPCLTCSHTGSRLGHGGGFYDTYFSQNKAIPSVMICREQIICEEIPREAHDLIFDCVVTESGVYRNGSIVKARID